MSSLEMSGDRLGTSIAFRGGTAVKQTTFELEILVFEALTVKS